MVRLCRGGLDISRAQHLMEHTVLEVGTDHIGLDEWLEWCQRQKQSHPGASNTQFSAESDAVGGSPEWMSVSSHSPSETSSRFWPVGYV